MDLLLSLWIFSAVLICRVAAFLHRPWHNNPWPMRLISSQLTVSHSVIDWLYLDRADCPFVVSRSKFLSKAFKHNPSCMCSSSFHSRLRWGLLAMTIWSHHTEKLIMTIYPQQTDFDCLARVSRLPLSDCSSVTDAEMWQLGCSIFTDVTAEK